MDSALGHEPLSPDVDNVFIEEGCALLSCVDQLEAVPDPRPVGFRISGGKDLE